MRRALTDEQSAARDARRQAFRDLARKIGAMPEGERAALAENLPAIATVEGRALSPFNMCMIASQCPTASIVGGFRQWIKAGRVVRKGEHGLGLWIPASARKSEDGDGAQDVRFIMGTVFDVSQTVEADTVAQSSAEPRQEPEPVAAPDSGKFTFGGFINKDAPGPEYSEQFTPIN